MFRRAKRAGNFWNVHAKIPPDNAANVVLWDVYFENSRAGGGGSEHPRPLSRSAPDTGQNARHSTGQNSWYNTAQKCRTLYVRDQMPDKVQYKMPGFVRDLLNTIQTEPFQLGSTVELGTFFVHVPILLKLWQDDDTYSFQGQGSNVKVTCCTLLWNLGNMRQNEPFQLTTKIGTYTSYDKETTPIDFQFFFIGCLTSQATMFRLYTWRLLIFKVIGQRSRSHA